MVETFTWCPSPGPVRTRSLRLTEVKYGDGYTHRVTTGINPIQDSWAVLFVGTQTYLNDIDGFLFANAVQGFWWKPPGWPGVTSAPLMTCDEWTLTYTDRQRDGQLLGSLNATFVRQYNIQPGGPMP